jgi:hypothetical protein
VILSAALAAPPSPLRLLRPQFALPSRSLHRHRSRGYPRHQFALHMDQDMEAQLTQSTTSGPAWTLRLL